MEFHSKLRARNRQRKHRALKKKCKNDMDEALHSIRTDCTPEKTDDTDDNNLQDFLNCNTAEHIGIGPAGVCESETDQDIPHVEDLDNFQEELLQADLQSDLQLEADFQHTPQAENTEIEEIRTWAIESNLSCFALDKLLKILRKRLLTDLPKSSKTFLKTTLAEYDITEMQDSSSDGIPGEYVYLGIATGLESCINTSFHERIIEIIVNIDGLPLTKSGGKCFWPILCKVHYIPDVYKPFTVAIYCGASKPKNLSLYLEDFINELNYLQKHGLIINNKRYTVQLKCLVADTPARSYLKCAKGHGGYSACERCTVYGVRTKVGKGLSVVYPGSNYPERTNASFRNHDDPGHHTGVSPLEKIYPELDMPKICVLDFMHLGSGVTKKILEMLMFGPMIAIRLSRRQKLEISRRLLCLRLQLPSEFQRKTRSLLHVRQWKATEFRFFLLYGGPIVLKNVISENLYKHFLLLHTAFRILCSDQLAVSFNAVAKRYLEKFVLALPLLYGTAAQVLNMHNLVHIADDVMNLGCSLSRINCFPFESSLGAIKRTLRTVVNPVAQVCRREHERKMLQSEVSLPKECTIHKSGVINGNLMIKRLTTNYSTFLTTKAPNNMVLLKNGCIMRIDKIFGYDTSVLSAISITGHIWKSKIAAYSYPRKSDVVESWEINVNSSRTIMTYPLSYVQRKLLAMQLSMKPEGRNRLFVMSLLHST